MDSLAELSSDSESRPRRQTRRKRTRVAFSSTDSDGPATRTRKRCRESEEEKVASTASGDGDESSNRNRRTSRRPQESGDGASQTRRRTARVTSDTPSGSSDSEEVIFTRRTNRRRHQSRVITESDSETSEGSEIIPYRRQGRRFYDNSESNDDVSGWVMEQSTRPPGHVRTVASVRSIASQLNMPNNIRSSAQPASDSENEDGAEKCAICLRSIRTQEVGTPEGCDHTFCLSCLQTWSQTVNKCPMDRQPFRLILVKENINGPVTRQLAVEEREMPVLFEEDTTFCLLCGGFNNEERMLLCDGCDRGFHLECLTPPLDAVPEVDEWFCLTCQAWQQVTADLAARAASSTVSGTLGPRRVIGVRLRRRSNLSPIHRISQRFADEIANAWRSHDREPANAAVAGPSSSGLSSRPRAARARKTVTRRKKRKVAKRRYVTKKKKIFIENEDGTVTEETISVKTKVTRRRKKRRVVKRKPRRTTSSRTSRRAAAKSPRSRLAETLGMCPPSREGLLLPEVSARRKTPATAANLSRASALPTLHIFGPRNELAPVSSGSEDEDVGEGGVGLLSRSRIGLSTRPLDRRKAIELLRSAPSSRPRPVIRPAQTSQAPADLLSSILECQTIWHSKNSDVTVRHDGSVEMRPTKPIDVRTAAPERVSTAVSPGTSSSNFTSAAAGSSSGPSSSQPQQEVSSSSSSGPRLGGAHNDREGYANYLNNMSARPAPLSRGGPPLRFRMPVRPQLRRIPLLPRRSNRVLYEDDDDISPDPEKSGNTEDTKNPDDVDLYSDIEASNTEVEGSEAEGACPALGPPPEPPAFLLNMTMAPEKDAYDPAEPCDSDEEMVIDEHAAQPETAEPPAAAPELPEPPALPAELAETLPSPNDTDCPVVSLYSSASLEFSRKGEEERALQLADSLSRDGLTESQDSHDQDTLSPPSESPKYAQDNETSDKPKRSDSPASSLSKSRSNSSSPEPRRERKRSRRSSHSNSPVNHRNSGTNPPTDGQSGGELPRVSVGLEGLDVEEVSSDMEGNEFNDAGRLSSISLSGISDQSRFSSPSRRKKKKRKRSTAKSRRTKRNASEEGEIESDKDKPKKADKRERKTSDENKIDSERRKKRHSKSKSPERKVLSSQENNADLKEDDNTWKKRGKKDRNYRENRKSSKERALSKEKRTSRSASPKKKSKDRKKSDKKKEIERYDVRKVVKEKETNRKDEFGRDLPDREISKSRSRSLSAKRRGSQSPEGSKSPVRRAIRSPVRRGSRSPVRRGSRSPKRRTSRSPSFGRHISRSPVRRISRSPVRRGSRSPFRRTSRSPIRRVSRSPVRRGRRKRSGSRSPDASRRRRKKSSNREGKLNRAKGRSSKRSPSRSPKRRQRSKKSRSRSLSLSPAPRARKGYSPPRNRRSGSPVPVPRSFIHAWSPDGNKRAGSLENLTVVLTSKEKKKKKKKKDDKREKKTVEGKKKKAGNSKEVFASGDNVLVSVNFSKTNKNSGNPVPIIIPAGSPVREVSSKKKKRTAAEAAKKSKSAATTKTAVDAALSNDGAKRKKLTRLTQEDAEVILNRKPVAVIDLDMSPYREQTPSPINVVVVSDSGSGDEGKAPQRSGPVIMPPAHLNTSTGPKTPPEPPLKFSISKQPQLRPIVNPLAEAEEPEEASDAAQNEITQDTPTKGPNTPPEPRGPSTPQRGPSTPPLASTPQSPQSSPDAYDPFEPTKSRSPSPERSNDVVIEKTPEVDPKQTIVTLAPEEPKIIEPIHVKSPEPVVATIDLSYTKDTSLEVVEAAPVANFSTPVRKSTPQPMTPTLPAFSLPSPKTPNRSNATPVSGIQRLQHRLGSPVNKTPNSVKAATTPEKRPADFPVRGKKNGPQDIEPIDMDDSPYSPASSEGDDLFEPPPSTPVQAPPPVLSLPTYKPKPKVTPTKAANKFDMLFGPSKSPIRNGSKNPPKAIKPSKPPDSKTAKGKKPANSKMEEDQLRILDEVPSSAVELQVKDKFLKKLNRQERVVDEVKTVLKPHYAKKHITKEEYKDILRRAVPKICHSKSGEINPSKIQHLVEAYVQRCRHNKKQGKGQKQSKIKSTMFS